MVPTLESVHAGLKICPEPPEPPPALSCMHPWLSQFLQRWLLAPECPSSPQRYPEPAPHSAVLCQNLATARGLAVTSPWGPSFASNATRAMPCRGPQRSSASLYLGHWPSGMSLHQPVWVSVGKRVRARQRRGGEIERRKGLGIDFFPDGLSQPSEISLGLTAGLSQHAGRKSYAGQITPRA